MNNTCVIYTKQSPDIMSVTSPFSLYSLYSPTLPYDGSHHIMSQSPPLLPPTPHTSLYSPLLYSLHSFLLPPLPLTTAPITKEQCRGPASSEDSNMNRITS